MRGGVGISKYEPVEDDDLHYQNSLDRKRRRRAMVDDPAVVGVSERAVVAETDAAFRYLLHYKPRLVLTSRPPRKKNIPTSLVEGGPRHDAENGRGKAFDRSTSNSDPYRFFPKAGKYFAGGNEDSNGGRSEESGSGVPLISDLLQAAAKEQLHLRSSGKNDLDSVAPVGRLDLDSEGLILLTDDRRLSTVVTSPSYGHSKVYRVMGKAKRCVNHSPLNRDAIDGGSDNLAVGSVVAKKRAREAVAKLDRALSLSEDEQPACLITQRESSSFCAVRRPIVRVMDAEYVPANIFVRRFFNEKSASQTRCSTTPDISRGEPNALTPSSTLNCKVLEHQPETTTRLDSPTHDTATFLSTPSTTCSSSQSTSPVVEGERQRETSCPKDVLVAVFEVTLFSGKKHEVRRLLRDCGFQTLTLQRVEVCGIGRDAIAQIETVQDALTRYREDTQGVQNAPWCRALRYNDYERLTTKILPEGFDRSISCSSLKSREDYRWFTSTPRRPNQTEETNPTVLEPGQFRHLESWEVARILEHCHPVVSRGK
ncbi:unnamed protein product [Amoebophrya sp. A25]|nr:unnamed protein product [Amoebophrya sp. A25]|eukprot:GSA25T00000475001.1